MTNPTLPTGPNLSLQQISSFIDQHGTKNSKLYAKDVNGQAVLYLKDSGGISNFFKGKTSQKQDAARAIVRDLADKAIDAMPTRSEQLKKNLGSIKDTLDSGRLRHGGGDLSGAKVKNLAKGVEMLRSRLSAIQPQPQGGAVRLTADNPTVNLASLGQGFGASAIMQRAAQELSQGTLSSQQKQALVDGLGDAIATAFRNANPGANQREAFMLSSGATLRNDLASALTQGGQAMPDLDEVLGQAVMRAASKVSDDQATSTGVSIPMQKGRKPITVPEMTIGGVLYTPVKNLGSGGFGHVFQYVEKNPPQNAAPRELAIKIQSELGGTDAERADLLKIAAEEHHLHRTALGQGNDHVMGGGGAVRLADGRIALTSEVLPHGDIYEFQHKLHASVESNKNPVPSGKITPDEARLIGLTLIQDMAKGLAHMHDTTGVTHYDFKGPNCMIGADGKAKIVDFGESTTDQNIQISKKKKIDNKVWISPELVLGGGELVRIDTYRKTIESDTRKTVSAQMPEVFKLLGINPKTDSSKSFSKAFSGNIASDVVPKDLTDAAKSKVKVDHRTDIWSLGATAYMLLANRELAAPGGFMSEIESALADFGRSGGDAIDSNAVGPNAQVSKTSLAPSTGDRQIDALLNGMLKGKPGDRAEARDIVTDAMFNRPGVGSAEVRDLIKAIASGDATKIDKARQDLAAAQAPKNTGASAPSDQVAST